MPVGGEDERALRRRLGPVASAVLADLVLDADRDGAGALVVATSVRRVAAHLGVGKDTAARALRRLSSVGVLERRPQGADRAGRFGAGRYELRLVLMTPVAPCPPDGDAVRGGRPTAVDPASDTVPASGSPDTVAISTSSRRRRRATGRAEAAQLSLLDVTPASAANDSAGHREPK